MYSSISCKNFFILVLSPVKSEGALIFTSLVAVVSVVVILVSASFSVGLKAKGLESGVYGVRSFSDPDSGSVSLNSLSGM
jgi:hypothetical protein